MVSRIDFKTAFGDNDSTIDEQNRAIEGINAGADILHGVDHDDMRILLPERGRDMGGAVITVGKRAVKSTIGRPRVDLDKQPKV